MRKSTSNRRGRIRLAALLSLSGLVIAACSAGPDDPAPVYMMGAPSTEPNELVASVPIERTISEPIALAPSLTASASPGHQTSDVIPLDDPPAAAQERAKRAMLTANPAPMSARFMPPPEPMPAPAAEATPSPPPPTLTASPAPVAASITAASVPPPASVAPAPTPEPSPVAAARVEAVPPPAPAPAPIAQPPVADIATPGLVIAARDERAARSRPRYYYSP